MVVAAAGNLDHAKVVRLVAPGVRRHRRWTPTRRRPRRTASAEPAVRTEPATTLVRSRDTEQAHVMLGGPGIDRARRAAVRARRAQQRRSAAACRSRLFQEIREKRGLAYSVYSYACQYADTGFFGVYAGCAPGKVDEVLGADPRRAGPGGRRRHHRRRARPRQGDAQGLAGAGPGGHRLADVPAGQGRAAVRRADVGRRDARPGRRGDRRRRSASWPPSCSSGRCRWP